MRNFPFTSVRALREMVSPSRKEKEKPAADAERRTPGKGRRLFSSITVPVTVADRASRSETSGVSPVFTRTASLRAARSSFPNASRVRMPGATPRRR